MACLPCSLQAASHEPSLPSPSPSTLSMPHSCLMQPTSRPLRCESTEYGTERQAAPLQKGQCGPVTGGAVEVTESRGAAFWTLGPQWWWWDFSLSGFFSSNNRFSLWSGYSSLAIFVGKDCNLPPSPLRRLITSHCVVQWGQGSGSRPGGVLMPVAGWPLPFSQHTRPVQVAENATGPFPR